MSSWRAALELWVATTRGEMRMRHSPILAKLLLQRRLGLAHRVSVDDGGVQRWVPFWELPNLLPSKVPLSEKKRRRTGEKKRKGSSKRPLM